MKKTRSKWIKTKRRNREKIKCLTRGKKLAEGKLYLTHVKILCQSL